MALVSWLKGSYPTKSDTCPGKIHHFGAHFDGHIFLETVTLQPYGKLKGKLYIETRFMLKFKGIHIQLEADLYAKFTSESGRNIHRKRVCILENTEIRKNGDQLSPIREDLVKPEGNHHIFVIHPEDTPQEGSDSSPTCENFEFCLTATGEQLPTPFTTSYGSLEYKVVAYMLSVDGRYVQIAEHPLEFSGYLNLNGRENLLEPVKIKKGLHDKSGDYVHAELELEKGTAYLPEEKVPFTVTVRNPKRIPLQILVFIALKITYNVDGAIVPICSRVGEAELFENEPKGDTLWNGALTIPKGQCLSYHDKNPAYDVRYAIQLKVKVENYGSIKGTHLLMVGSTRESSEVIKKKVENVEVKCNPWVDKRGDNTSVKSEGGYRGVRQGRGLNRNPSLDTYSQVNSPLHAVEAVHLLPDYLDHLEFVDEEISTPVPSPSQSKRGSMAE